ncbi:MAG: transport system permease protein [Myxococcales bacterium]|nr:transport system permease protein [Myxococcales bacterium]
MTHPARATPARVATVTLASLVVALAAIAASLAVGVERASLGRALADRGSLDAAILFGARGPRVLLGALVGGALAVAGVAFQALLRNPLADPFVLGVSGGAAVAGTAAAFVGGAGALGIWMRPLWAFGGALVAVAAVFVFGRVRGQLVPHVALLAGVVINALAAALILALRTLLSPNAFSEAIGWLAGSLATVDATRVLTLAVYSAVALVVLARSAVDLNALALGEDAARTVGVDVERARRVIFFAASLLTAAAVAFAGPIGFVGIVVPHALRRLVGADHRVLLPAALFGGAAFLVAADSAARLAFLAVGSEPAVGVLTALIGAPLFLVILRRRGGERAL